MNQRLAGRGSRFEVSTNTRDPSLQLVFADPAGTLTQLGLSIPSVVPTFYGKANLDRYQVLLVSVKFVQGESARLVGMRQRLLIGQNQPGGDGGSNPYPVYTPVVTPEWHFSDGNVSWHLRRMALETVASQSIYNAAELAFRTSDTPSVLFENAPVQSGGYAAPYGGAIPGNVLLPEFGDFHDMRFPWQDDHAWDSMDVEIRGPCAINLYASIRQTNPSTRTPLVIGSANPNVLVPEEQFLLNFSQSVYTRIAGSLIFERANFVPATQDLVECDPGNVPANTEKCT